MLYTRKYWYSTEDKTLPISREDPTVVADYQYPRGICLLLILQGSMFYRIYVAAGSQLKTLESKMVFLFLEARPTIGYGSVSSFSCLECDLHQLNGTLLNDNSLFGFTTGSHVSKLWSILLTSPIVSSVTVNGEADGLKKSNPSLNHVELAAIFRISGFHLFLRGYYTVFRTRKK
ncbi:uncharacterized protein [Rutidosis leptorrhynchoides]|uniref:uncharacterized protein isoform X2 n=1 Tax=Rutidosis leptorrhynchoides TaxID=125765 RepID=UPI003A98EADC